MLLTCLGLLLPPRLIFPCMASESPDPFSYFIYPCSVIGVRSRVSIWKPTQFVDRHLHRCNRPHFAGIIDFLIDLGCDDKVHSFGVGQSFGSTGDLSTCLMWIGDLSCQTSFQNCWYNAQERLELQKRYNKSHPGCACAADRSRSINKTNQYNAEIDDLIWTVLTAYAPNCAYAV